MPTYCTYCTVDDVQEVLPKNILIGTNILKGQVNVTTSQVEFWINQTAGQIDSALTSFYRVPLMLYKEPDWSQDPVTFIERYPIPVTLINARLAAASIYDKIIMANQEPNVSDWGKAQRGLAFDDIRQIQTGQIQLRGQVRTGRRFVRQELFDPARVPVKPDLQPHNRAPGE